MSFIKQSGFLFTNFKSKSQTPFEKLFEIFKELITYTSGDFDEAIDWLKELDKEYVLTSEDYTMDDFIEELLNKGYIKKEIDPNGNGEGVGLTAKTEMLLRQHALKQIFGKTPEQAHNITMKIHKDGQGIVGSYSHEVAEQKGIEATLAARQENFPLQIKVKKQ